MKMVSPPDEPERAPRPQLPAEVRQAEALAERPQLAEMQQERAWRELASAAQLAVPLQRQVEPGKCCSMSRQQWQQQLPA